MTQCAAPSAAAVAARRAMKKSFQTRGILTAVSSGMVYGMYTALFTYAMAMGIWAVWYGENSGLSEFAVLFLLSALGAGLTDGCAAIWALIMAALRGKLGDFGRSFKTRRGLMLVFFYVLLVISVITNKTYFIRGEGLILRERAE